MTRLSVIIPCLDEAASLQGTLVPLQALRAQGHEVILVDGGSRDGSRALARPWVDRLIQVAPGRSAQLLAGVGVANGDVFWFLHADTRVPEAACEALRAALAAGHCWGRFDVQLSGTGWGLRLVQSLMNLRSRWTGIATGDQAIFVTRACYEAAGGLPPLELMEDVAFSRALKRLGPPACVRTRVTTSSRRWEKLGIARTVVLMWWLRLRFALGAHPADLARQYRKVR
jgi:rSAM/selenodomain-associated transferase 2